MNEKMEEVQIGYKTLDEGKDRTEASVSDNKIDFSDKGEEYDNDNSNSGLKSSHSRITFKKSAKLQILALLKKNYALQSKQIGTNVCQVS